MTNPYDYKLPPELLAHTPVEPRDSSRLLVVDTTSSELGEDVFKNIADYLPEGALLVMNDTKVVPARVFAKKETGGKVEILFLVNEWKGVGPVPAISDRKLTVGQKVFLDCEVNRHRVSKRSEATGRHSVSMTVVEQRENIFFFKLEFPANELLGLLMQVGETPLPKYISKTPLPESWLRERYQSVLAERPASIAAPTASLHFTDAVFESLKKKGVEVAKVTLHVGLGTFAPVGERELTEGKLHEEYYEISKESAEAIRKAKKEGRPVVAVGTTVVRALESAASSSFPRRRESSTVSDTLDPSFRWDDNGFDGCVVSGSTRFFIRPPYEFKVVDHLITNFHLPESSLMYLVDSMLQYKNSKLSILEIYNEAIRRRFRFYSFGDAMLIRE